MTMANLAGNKAPGERKGRRQPRSYQELCSISGTTASRHAAVTDTPPDRDQHQRNQTPGPINPETLGQCGPHQAAGHNFLLPHEIAETTGTQTGWRFCAKCAVLILEGQGDGTCASDGAAHQPAG